MSAPSTPQRRTHDGPRDSAGRPVRKRSEGRRRACDYGPRPLLASLLAPEIELCLPHGPSALKNHARRCRARAGPPRLLCHRHPLRPRCRAISATLPPSTLPLSATLPPPEPARVPFHRLLPPCVCVARKGERTRLAPAREGASTQAKTRLSAALFTGKEKSADTPRCALRERDALRGHAMTFAKNATFESTCRGVVPLDLRCRSEVRGPMLRERRDASLKSG